MPTREADRWLKTQDERPDDAWRCLRPTTNEAATGASPGYHLVPLRRQLPDLISSTLLFESHSIDLTCVIRGLLEARRLTRLNYPGRFSMSASFRGLKREAEHEQFQL